MKLKSADKLILLLALTYFVSYVTRLDYSAVIAEMVKATDMSKAELSLAVTGNFLCYGIGLVLGGYIGDKVQPRKLVICGLGVAALANIAVPVCSNYIEITAAWSINGFAQALLWPAIVKLMISFLSDDEYKKGTVYVAYGSSLGTIAVYLISPIIIYFSGWRIVFWVAAAVAVLMILVWLKRPYDVSNEVVKSGGKKEKIFTPMLFLIMIAIVLHGALRDGITTWMPTYICETFNLSTFVSIISGVILPIFSILCFNLTEHIYKKHTNPVLCAQMIFTAGAAAAFLLYVFSESSASLSVILSAILTGCMQGVSLLLVSMLPQYFAKTGKVSFVSGVLNACTFTGSALSAYVIAVLSDLWGWKATVLSWVLLAVIGAVICKICVKEWNEKMQPVKEDK